mmetsp:Transcript_14913/g.37915  ORF Transcript_14913/g.37915 Transcript_14913/m.37915 type:complete len:302 (-) Transcript_14913:163-1068(-)
MPFPGKCCQKMPERHLYCLVRIHARMNQLNPLEQPPVNSQPQLFDQQVCSCFDEFFHVILQRLFELSDRSRLHGRDDPSVHGLQLVSAKQFLRRNLSHQRLHRDEVLENEAAIALGARVAVVESVGQVPVCLDKVLVEHGQAPDEKLVRDAVCRRELVERDEVLGVHDADKVLAVPQSIQAEVDPEELIHNPQCCPSLFATTPWAIRCGEAGHELIPGILKLFRFLALLVQLCVRLFGDQSDVVDQGVQRAHQPRLFLLAKHIHEHGNNGNEGGIRLDKVLRSNALRTKYMGGHHIGKWVR